MTAMTPQEALARTIEHREIFQDEMLDLMRQIMRGEISAVMTAAILTGLRVKKETVGEIAAAAMVMREFAIPVAVAPGAPFVDIVGTGGDGAHTFNISTASMFVAAAAGARVAKHGNRSVSSRSGAADVLEALGAAISLDAHQVAQCLAQTGIGFMFAPNHHPAMKNVGPVRREMERVELEEAPQLERAAAREACLDVLTARAAFLGGGWRNRAGVHLRAPLAQLAPTQRRACILTSP
jgi:anthranilate phosphoribosyltransferase